MNGREPAQRARVASLAKGPHEVAAMFDGVSRRYDLTNVVLSLGQDQRWRRRTRRALGLRPGRRVLDVAAGTGVSTAQLAGAGITAVACDFSLGMLRAGRRRRARCGVPFVAGDALALPFGDATFDAVTISFGLRNVIDPVAALREMARVTKPGGTLVVCEFSHPTLAPLRWIYLSYLMRALPSIARRVASNPDAYVYLAESIRAWPSQTDLAGRIAAAGWRDVYWRDLSFGIVALHQAVRRSDADRGAPGAAPPVDTSGAGPVPHRPPRGEKVSQWRSQAIPQEVPRDHSTHRP